MYVRLIDDGMKEYTNEFVAQQTNTAIITPQSTNYKAVVKAVAIATDAAAGEVRVKWATSGKLIAILYATKTNNLMLGGIHNGYGALGESVDITTTTSTSKVFVGINWLEKN